MMVTSEQSVKRKVTMTNILLAAMVTCQVATLVAIAGGLVNVRHDLAEVLEKLEGIRTLQLNPRTRITKANMRNKPVTQDDELAKLGRIAAPHRVVVGGDDDSRLSKNLRGGLKSPGDADG